MRHLLPLLALACTGCSGWALSFQPIQPEPLCRAPIQDFALPSPPPPAMAAVESRPAPTTAAAPGPTPPVPTDRTEVRVGSEWTAVRPSGPIAPDPFEE